MIEKLGKVRSRVTHKMFLLAYVPLQMAKHVLIEGDQSGRIVLRVENAFVGMKTYFSNLIPRQGLCKVLLAFIFFDIVVLQIIQAMAPNSMLQ